MENKKRLFLILGIIAVLFCSVILYVNHKIEHQLEMGDYATETTAEETSEGASPTDYEADSVTTTPGIPGGFPADTGITERDTMSGPGRGPAAAPAPDSRSTPQEAVAGYLNKGKLAHFVPDSMQVGTPSKITLIISRNKSTAALRNSLETAIRHAPGADTSRIVLEHIRVSRQMTAQVYTMDTSAFAIRPLSRAQQYVHLQDTTETRWEWAITPLKGGTHNLIIKISAKVFDGQIEDWIEIEVYNGLVSVKALPPTPIPDRLVAYWKQNWMWILPTLGAIGTFITWFLSVIKRRRQ